MWTKADASQIPDSGSRLSGCARVASAAASPKPSWICRVHVRQAPRRLVEDVERVELEGELRTPREREPLHARGADSREELELNTMPSSSQRGTASRKSRRRCLMLAYRGGARDDFGLTRTPPAILSSILTVAKMLFATVSTNLSSVVGRPFRAQGATVQ